MPYPYNYQQRCQVSEQRQLINQLKEEKKQTIQDLKDILLIIDDSTEEAKRMLSYLIKTLLEK